MLYVHYPPAVTLASASGDSSWVIDLNRQHVGCQIVNLVHMPKTSGLED